MCDLHTIEDGWSSVAKKRVSQCRVKERNCVHVACMCVCARWKSNNSNNNVGSSNNNHNNNNSKNLVSYVRFPCSLRCFSVPKVQTSAAWNQHQRQVRTKFLLSLRKFVSVALLIVQMPQIQQHPVTIDMYSFGMTTKFQIHK